MRETFFKSQRVTPFVECPNCGRLVEYGAEMCPACREEIGADYARLSAAVVAFNTRAVSLANTIKTGDAGAVIVFLVSAYVYVYDLYDPERLLRAVWLVTLVTPALSLAAVALWFFRFGRFRIGDDDFERSRRDMKWSLMIWSALFAVQLIALATLYL